MFVGTVLKVWIDLWEINLFVIFYLPCLRVCHVFSLIQVLFLFLWGRGVRIMKNSIFYFPKWKYSLFVVAYKNFF